MHIRTRDAIAFQIGIVIFLSIVFLIIAIPLWRVIMTAVVPLDIYTSEGIPFFLAPWKWSAEAFRQLITHSLFPQRAPEQWHYHPGRNSHQPASHRTSCLWIVNK